ncbi:MAG: GNAT family N-acetyltransferase [Acidobacteria bacterium]|nr:GNAT family N-acetyltransferase [Acidobacteriota bacterium]
MNVEIRNASIDDLQEIIRLIADDYLGQQRENFELPLNENYVKAFREIDADPNNELIVAELDGDLVGTMQLTLTPSLSFQGGRRCTVESVRVDEQFRGKGIGREMMLWAIEWAKEKTCVSMQLTSHISRERAHRFYEDLGFSKSHVGMKLKLK